MSHSHRIEDRKYEAELKSVVKILFDSEQKESACHQFLSSSIASAASLGQRDLVKALFEITKLDPLPRILEVITIFARLPNPDHDEKKKLINELLGMIKKLRDDPEGLEKLKVNFSIVASESNSPIILEVVNILLSAIRSRGGDVTENMYDCFVQALAAPAPSVIEFMLQKKLVNPNELYLAKYFNFSDKSKFCAQGYTNVFLELCTYHKRAFNKKNEEDFLKIFASFMRHGADVNKPLRLTKLKTPIENKIENKQDDSPAIMKKELIKDAIDYTGKTPLMAACQAGFNLLAEALIKQGAKLDAQDIFGNTALGYAVNFCQSKTVDLILSFQPALDILPLAPSLYSLAFQGRYDEDVQHKLHNAFYQKTIKPMILELAEKTVDANTKEKIQFFAENISSEIAKQSLFIFVPGEDNKLVSSDPENPVNKHVRSLVQKDVLAWLDTIKNNRANKKNVAKFAQGWKLAEYTQSQQRTEEKVESKETASVPVQVFTKEKIESKDTVTEVDQPPIGIFIAIKPADAVAPSREWWQTEKIYPSVQKQIAILDRMTKYEHKSLRIHDVKALRNAFIGELVRLMRSLQIGTILYPREEARILSNRISHPHQTSLMRNGVNYRGTIQPIRQSVVYALRQMQNALRPVGSKLAMPEKPPLLTELESRDSTPLSEAQTVYQIHVGLDQLNTFQAIRNGVLPSKLSEDILDAAENYAVSQIVIAAGGEQNLDVLLSELQFATPEISEKMGDRGYLKELRKFAASYRHGSDQSSILSLIASKNRNRTIEQPAPSAGGTHPTRRNSV